MNFHVYRKNQDGGPWWLKAQWRGEVGRLRLKGWWTVGRRHTRDRCEVELALGGEDNMLQVGLAIPWVARVYAGVRVPGWVTRGWVHHRRVLAVRPGYAGSLAYIEVLHDDEMADMADYYRRQRAAGKAPSTGRAQGWPGWRWRLEGGLRDRLLGKPVYRRVNLSPAGGPVEVGGAWRSTWETLSTARAVARYGHGLAASSDELLVVEHALVPLPEGAYPAVVSLHRDDWKRPRASWRSRIVYRAEITPRVAIPVPGKGENSWDVDDDATFSMTCPARTVPQAVAALVESVLSDRARHAGPGWTPAEGWPDRVAVEP